MTSMATGAAKRVVLEVVGWALVVAGVAALVLPGPGLLMLFAGLAVLSNQYAWARRLMMPVKIKALKGAADGVETKARIALSALASLVMAAIAALWLWHPPAPAWWSLNPDWWLFGGRAVGVTLAVSTGIAIGLLGYAVRRFHGKPAAVAEVLDMERDHREAVERAKNVQRLKEEAAERAGR